MNACIAPIFEQQQTKFINELNFLLRNITIKLKLRSQSSTLPQWNNNTRGFY